MLKGCLTNKTKAFDANYMASNLYSLATARGANKDKLLHGTGIFTDDFTNNRLLSVNQLLILIQNAQHLCDGNDTAFQFGHSLVNTIDTQHPDLVTALKSASDFLGCMRVLSIMNAQIFPFMSAHTFKDPDNIYIVLQDSIGLRKNQTFMIEASCTALVAMSKRCIGRRLKFSFLFPYSRPKHIYEYEENLGSRLTFSHSMLTIKIPISEVEIPCPDRHLGLNRYAVKTVLNKRLYKFSLIDKIRSQLRSKPSRTLPELAKLNRLSQASFKRVLNDHSISFQQLVDELCCQEALYYLQIQKLKNEQSAVKMRFNDVNNFRRAVKRCTGLTPSELRQA
jgi:AraC-like DNA-binding protein